MATPNFDFKAYNDMIKPANSGLRLFLALQQLQEVESVMRRYKSPFAQDLVNIVDELTDLRERNKKYLASRETTTSSNIDNPEGLATSTTDVQTEYDRVKQAKDAGVIA
jgi:hypothetical protein